jgi:AraC-like DNA-binding protein
MEPNSIVSLKSYAEGVSLHVHDFHQLVIPTHGTMEIEVDGTQGHLTNARGILIPAASHHRFNASSGSQYVVADIPIDFRLADGRPVGALHLLDQRFFSVPLSFCHLIAFLRGAVQEQRAVDTGAWLRLALSAISGQAASVTDAKYTPLAKATTFMRANLDQPITCKHVAVAAGVSERKLNYLFNQSLRMTPHAYLLELRIERAIGLLSGSRLPISDIARASGFSDQSALTHALKRARDITPARLRRASA